MFCIFLSQFVYSVYQNTTASCKIDASGNLTFKLEFDKTYDAWATFEDSYDELGWGQIHIWTNPHSPSYNQMYCAGFVDTYLTQERVREAFTNYKEVQVGKGKDWPASWKQFISENINYVRSNIMNSASKYWKDIGLVINQVDGMLRGLNEGVPESDQLSEIDFWLLQSAGDLDDLAGILEGSAPRDPELTLKCTGLVMYSPDYDDIYFAQDTWSHYTDLHAYLKDYNLNIPEFKAHHVTVSTRTGHLPSVDDFWTTDQGLLIMETTMHNFNNTLYELYVKPQSVLTWLRSYYATFVTDNGEDWTKEFIKENSGTYNNQYIVLDTKLFVKNSTKHERPKNLLWVLEQLPGFYESADLTDLLYNTSYFGSVNSPIFESVFNLADYPGEQQREPKKKDFWSYWDQPRYKIIERDVPKITGYNDFQEFMRYNDYLHDPLLLIDGIPEPAQGILSRYDLRPENGTSYGAKNCFGGLDTKAARLSWFLENQTWDAILSPEYKYNAPFSFLDWPDVTRKGLKDTYKHDWITFRPKDYCEIYGGNDKESCKSVPGCGFCFKNKKCMRGEKDGPQESMGYKCSSGWIYETVTPAYATPMVASISVIVVVFVGAIYVSAYLKYRKSKQVY
ncbi:Laminin A family protein [Histomonas meleagridis]|uniref:Laminin A family protein n=1 Tax=Histomonas meleagridis TaxID=135588 RepID=UPI0035598EA5|nr:Laminin A family protein [Histomonas meleagridis]KAH0805619.1 Laminin A family protein [Histomonas meleagridis]